MDHHRFQATGTFYSSPHRSSFTPPSIVDPAIESTLTRRKNRFSNRRLAAHLHPTSTLHETTFQSPPPPTRSRHSCSRSNRIGMRCDNDNKEERDCVEQHSKNRHASMSQERRSQCYDNTEAGDYHLPSRMPPRNGALRPGHHRYSTTTPMSPIRPTTYVSDLSEPRLPSPPRIPRRHRHSTVNPFLPHTHHSHTPSTSNGARDVHQIHYHHYHHYHHQHQHQHHDSCLPHKDTPLHTMTNRIQRRREGATNTPPAFILRNPKPPVQLYGHKIVGHPALKVHRLRLPDELINLLDKIVNGCEQYTKTLPDGWSTDLYSLTKQDVALREIPHIFDLSRPIMSYLKKTMLLLYGYRSLKVDRNQPHVLKYGIGEDPSNNGGEGDHTGVELHHDKCDVTVNLMMSRGNTYRGGGTYFPDAEQIVRLEHGEFLLHPGSCVHGGADITGGTRYLMVIFANEKK